MARFTCSHCGLYKSDKTSNFKRHVSTCISAKLDQGMDQHFKAAISQPRNPSLTFGSQIITPNRMLEAPQRMKCNEERKDQGSLQDTIEEESDTNYAPKERKLKKRSAELDPREPSRHPKFNLLSGTKDPLCNGIFDSPNTISQSVFPTPPKLDADHNFALRNYEPPMSTYETFQLRRRLQDAQLHVERLQAQLFECNALVRSLIERQQHAASILLSSASQTSFTLSQ